MPSTHKPELHEAALQLIGQVYAAHQLGSGEIPFLTVAVLFGIALSDEERERLAARGAFHLDKKSETGGLFFNQGPEEKWERDGVRINVPASIGGTYASSPTVVQLDFTPASSIKVAVRFGPFWIGDRIQAVRVDQKVIFVDLAKGSDHDQTIVHA